MTEEWPTGYLRAEWCPPKHSVLSTIYSKYNLGYPVYNDPTPLPSRRWSLRCVCLKNRLATPPNSPYLSLPQRRSGTFMGMKRTPGTCSVF